MADDIVPATGQITPAAPDGQARQQDQQEKPSALQLVMKVCSIHCCIKSEVRYECSRVLLLLGLCGGI